MIKRKGFTLIEVIVVLIILAFVVLITIPIVVNIVNKIQKKADKVSVDNYGRAIELALSTYELEHGDYPRTIDELKIEYKGSNVNCNINRIRSNGEIFLSECYVDGNKVTDEKSYDKYYHYGKTDRDYVDLYGSTLERKIKNYVSNNNEIPSDISNFETKYDKDVKCEIKIHNDGTIYLTNCNCNSVPVKDDNNHDKYYHYGKQLLIDNILEKTNLDNITNYEDGNKSEMYTFNHSATDQTDALTDYRYIGNNPNNYVEFNDEVWRIIGVFSVEDENKNIEKRVKIIREEKYKDTEWDGRGMTHWNISYARGDLNNYYNQLSDSEKNMIAPTIFYLGNVTSSGSGEDFYIMERSNTSSNHIPYISENIALMYPSDYLYTYALSVASSCYSSTSCSSNYNKSWLYNNKIEENEWLISADSNNHVACIGPQYYTYGYRREYYGRFIKLVYSDDVEYGIRPTLYLNTNLKISNGDGSKDAPYKLMF